MCWMLVWDTQKPDGERNSWIINKTETEERCRESQNWNTCEREGDRQTAGPERQTHRRTETDRKRDCRQWTVSHG